MAVEVAADRDVCLGAGQCVLAAPELFDQDEAGLVVVVRDAATEGDAEAVRAAALVCPSRAISVRG
jgi:ferredoxin